MSWLARVLSPRAEYGPGDDYWYTPVGGIDTESGESVGPDLALQTSAVYACVRLVSEDVGTLPVNLYRRLQPRGKERATDHPLYGVIHDRPNEWQTAPEFWQLMQAHVELRGNAYAYIQPGPRGFCDQLIPLHPDRVVVKRIPRTYRLLYTWTSLDGDVRTFTADEVMHLRGLSLDGFVGLSTISYARETIGMQRAMERYRARFFRRDARPAVALMAKQELSDKARRNLVQSVYQDHGGRNSGGVMVLEEGMDIKTIGLSAEDSQWLEATQAGVADICRWFRVHPAKIGASSGDSMTYANVEQKAIEHVTDTLRPRCVRLEKRIAADLLLPEERDEYFAEINLDGLLRGDYKTRMEGHEIAIRAGLESPNEARDRENANPRSDAYGDAYYRGANLVPADTPASGASSTQSEGQR